MLNELSVPATFAFIYKMHGAKGIKQLLDSLAEMYETRGDSGTREGYEDVSDELNALGLKPLAAMVAEFAVTRKSRHDESLCVFFHAPYLNRLGNENNIRSFRQVTARDKKKRAKERKAKWN